MSGRVRDEIQGGAGISVPSGNTIILGTIGPDVLEGSMTFLKTSSGDELYIGVGGINPTASHYSFKLTDVLDVFEEAPVKGKISVASNSPTAMLDVYIALTTSKGGTT